MLWITTLLQNHFEHATWPLQGTSHERTPHNIVLHYVTWHNTSNHIASNDMTTTSNNMTCTKTSHITTMEQQKARSQQRNGLDIATSYRQILSSLSSCIFFWNFRPWLAWELFVHNIPHLTRINHYNDFVWQEQYLGINIWGILAWLPLRDTLYFQVKIALLAITLKKHPRLEGGLRNDGFMLCLSSDHSRSMIALVAQ